MTGNIVNDEYDKIIFFLVNHCVLFQLYDLVWKTKYMHGLVIHGLEKSVSELLARKFGHAREGARRSGKQYLEASKGKGRSRLI